MKKMGSRMSFRRFPVKKIAIFVIIALVFQIEIFINAQRVDEIEQQFQVARELFNRGEYESAGQRLERLMVVMSEKGLESNYIMGQCYLLQGAIFEKKDQPQKAEEYYLKAVDIGITKVEGAELDALELYRRIVKGEKPSGIIEAEGRKKKKKFPWLLVATGVVVVGLLVYFFVIKPKNKKYVLTVTKGVGVDGAPESGSYVYKKGTIVSYSYSYNVNGYSAVEVKLDDRPAPNSDTITMDRNHELVITATVVPLSFKVDKENVDINEGDTASINVQLSKRPDEIIVATVGRRIGSDTDITVIEGDSLTFTEENWNKDHLVKFRAAVDSDPDDDVATFDIWASGMPTKEITVKEKDIISKDAPPEISIKSPPDGDTVRGKVEILVDATDDKGIGRVEYYIDNVAKYTTQTYPYSYNWNTSGYKEDSHKIKVIAYDTVGQTAEDTINVSVDNDEPPTVSITSPSNGETVKGVITIRVDAVDDFGITEVELYIDGDQVESDNVPPYSFKFDTRAVPNGAHFIKARAYDSGNQFTDVEIVVTVDNR
jgi:hypothetical protein